jgi:hypothetical protein
VRPWGEGEGRVQGLAGGALDMSARGTPLSSLLPRWGLGMAMCVSRTPARVFKG